MKNYSMTCSCGHVMTTEGATREEAVGKLKAMMTPDAVAKHMADRHPGQPVMPVSQVHALIEQATQAA